MCISLVGLLYEWFRPSQLIAVSQALNGSGLKTWIGYLGEEERKNPD